MSVIVGGELRVFRAAQSTLENLQGDPGSSHQMALNASLNLRILVQNADIVLLRLIETE